MTIPDGLAGQVFLLAYDTDKHRLTVRPWLGYLLRAAALADLRGRRMIDDQDRRVRVLAVPPASSPVLWRLHREIAQDRPRTWAAWIRRDRRGTEDAVIEDLATAGFIVVDRPRRLWSRPRFHLADPRVLTRLRDRAAAILRSTEPPSRVPPNDAALIAILAVGDVRVALPKTKIKEYANRVAALTDRSEPIAQALKHALNAAKSAAS
jgi:Golgi phosphoprotein 3 (GPP34)